MNRQVRDPYAWWCERRTPLVIAGGAVYSIVISLFIINMTPYELLFSNQLNLN